MLMDYSKNLVMIAEIQGVVVSVLWVIQLWE